MSFLINSSFIIIFKLTYIHSMRYAPETDRHNLITKRDNSVPINE